VHVSDGTFTETDVAPRPAELGPLVDAARRELVAAGVEQTPDVVLADAGYWHQVQMQALAADGITVLVPPDANKRQGTRPGWNGGFYAFMRRALATPAGAALYRRRSGMIEPVFADTKSTARSTASYAAAEPPAGRNGG
jgi:hypothetical protein